ncbi:ComF family protein [Pinirhizobacter soli]|uniref:ComF family protein n=1 Tax=Pinirhizobacter soli TaxID=2786953 RepID=UPI00202A595F|nr:ComF family protein [Pinirhizobacter soli]
MDRLIPARCLLCHAPGDGMDLCMACLADMGNNHHACQHCGLPLPPGLSLCSDCVRQPPPWSGAWVPFRYAWPLDLLEARFKFHGDQACGKVLAWMWCAAEPPRQLPDAIMPVPLHRSRLRTRGYNQALELARPLARHLGLPLLSCLRRSRRTTAQTELDAQARRGNLRDAFSVTGLVPPHVAILDDVMTTGATMEACTRALLAGGATTVDAWALARA